MGASAGAAAPQATRGGHLPRSPAAVPRPVANDRLTARIHPRIDQEKGVKYQLTTLKHELDEFLGHDFEKEVIISRIASGKTNEIPQDTPSELKEIIENC